MADITDIKSILYTEKTLGMQEDGVIVVQTSPRMTKTGLKEVFREYFGIIPSNINSLNQNGKVKKFRGVAGKQNNFKKFYVTLPEGAQIESLAV
ncbi:MAG: 50S ribosomal protein L23 [Epsilonproteobacteria bacterium]|jgi:large subunit ribosomal protein L23|nr:50S ribosomal protein L23 [Campylobacterota bacterium]OIO13475.1 MAG: 50S ribosomal protein L23 [Helicobacteraceae bacterium CG1_02_36_14]PIP11268.1 MAG: 50S ribosomal protein L23 [Sulfurimonas sp. CG23_combo_of_CG06-09_8_20_14_all_36_33]PIS23912.1 MAG: 50S ribosomal protein L23 [Sulfurimonas sp. CG08_land_8_20_14_0_20_36_33]PIU35282.1 MAG: 50S ribosomal protein L23 [Sulfurimonas sp. CG07_land_8_20_14_0_80_36_56]PIV03945.1 MAG: 50S ribosomal protein L23 [Sulfurimonas sp. CG03_land_8_20_14_0